MTEQTTPQASLTAPGVYWEHGRWPLAWQTRDYSQNVPGTTEIHFLLQTLCKPLLFCSKQLHVFIIQAFWWLCYFSQRGLPCSLGPASGVLLCWLSSSQETAWPLRSCAHWATRPTLPHTPEAACSLNSELWNTGHPHNTVAGFLTYLHIQSQDICKFPKWDPVVNV